MELTRLEGTKHGNLIALQMLDVAVRVESIRPFACNQMVNIDQLSIDCLMFSLSSRQYFLQTRMFLSSDRIRQLLPRFYMQPHGSVENFVRTYTEKMLMFRV